MRSPATVPPALTVHARPAPLWVLALGVIGGTLAMHMFVPALPAAAVGLGASAAELQLTISLYIAGLALGQLVWGPVSDRIGRRPALLAGLSLYTVAGLVAWAAPTAGWLIAARLFQALGGCAGMVLGRAILRDTSSPQEAARRMALMNLMVTLGPGIAPLLGGTLVTLAGWRWVLGAMVLFGVIGLAAAWRFVAESAPWAVAAAQARAGAGAGAGAGAATAGAPAVAPGALPLAELLREYLGLLRSPRFLGWSVAGGCTTTAMYAFISAAPFVFVHDLGRPAHEVGGWVALMASGVWLGSVLASRLVRRLPLPRLLLGASALSLVAALVLLAAVLGGWLSLAVTIGASMAFTFAVGLASPAASTLAVSVNPRVIGSASGVYGFIQMGIGALCTAGAAMGREPALAAAVVLVTAAAVGQAACWMALGGFGRRRQLAEPQPAPRPGTAEALNTLQEKTR